MDHSPSQREALPAAYRLPHGQDRSEVCDSQPQVVFIEATNRCNLRCQTCPRTYFPLEPPQTLSLDAFERITSQFPQMQRALLHGIGEPLLNPNLPEMIRRLKRRGIQTLINSNATLLTPTRQAALIDSGLDELRCSLDAATSETYAQIRGAHAFELVVEGIRGLMELQRKRHAQTPRVSLWITATRQNLSELPGMVRLAGRLAVPEVYVQRLVYYADQPGQQFGLARVDEAVFGPVAEMQEQSLAEAESLAFALGITLKASGARDPRSSLTAAGQAQSAPWQACVRPWTTAYVTANGNCLPCCIAPFADRDYSSLILGNLFEQPFEQIWNGPAYRSLRARLLSDHPPRTCAGCGVYWSL